MVNKIIQHKRNILVCFVALLVIGIHLLTLMRYPEVRGDEAWLTSRAWAFNQTGRQFGPLDLVLVEQFKNYWIVNEWLLTVLQAAVLRLSTSPELFLVRSISLLFGFCLLGINYAIGKRLAGIPFAVVSTLLLAFSRAFFFSAHLVRNEIFATAFAYSALAILICIPGRPFLRGVLSGVVLGLAVETHLNSLIFIPVLFALIIVDDGWRFLQKSGFWGLTIGLCIGAGYFLIIHILPAPETYFQVNRLFFGDKFLPPLLTMSFEKISKGFSDAGMLLMAGVFSLVPLGAIQFISIIRERDRQKTKILLINGILFLGIALIFPKKNAAYSILLAPAFLWLVAGFCIDHFKQPWHSKISDYIQRILVLSCIGGLLAFSLIPCIPDNYQKYQDAQNKVNTYILDGDTVMGNQWYWFGLYNNKYYSWELLFIYPHLYPEKTLADSIEYFHPDVLIIDRQLSALVVDYVSPDSIWYGSSLPKKELEEYLTKNALLAARIQSELFGEIKIYRFEW